MNRKKAILAIFMMAFLIIIGFVFPSIWKSQKGNKKSETENTQHDNNENTETEQAENKKKLENLIGQLHAKGHHKLYINENGQIYIQNGDTAEIKDCFDYFPPRNYWDILISIFQKDELTAKEKDQALELSWIKE